MGGMPGPEQFTPPVYACAAGTVLHGHAADTLEPGVLLFTFLPPGAADDLAGSLPRVDVHADGVGASTVTVRALAGETALSWQLPLAPFVAALPGQSGDDGRMVLLAVVDAEPEDGFWAQPVDCGRLAAELQLPVAELAEALRGRLTPWLDEDLRLLLEDDDYHRAAERSPAQTLADAVVAQYRGDLEAEQGVSRLLRALTLAPPEHSVELGVLLCTALVAALDGTPEPVLQALMAETGPFETEVLRILGSLPDLLATRAVEDRQQAAMEFLLAADDRDETIRGALSAIARLARARYGAGLPDDELLRRLEVVDDAGQIRLARAWVALAAAAADVPAADATAAVDVLTAVAAEGPSGLRWLRATASTVGSLAEELAGRAVDRISGPLRAAHDLVTEEPDTAGVAGVIALARFLRARGRLGPAAWLIVPPGAAVVAVLSASLERPDSELTVDLLAELLAEDVSGVDLLDGFVCATAQVLAELEPERDDTRRRTQVAEALASVPDGPRGARWLLAACLREAHGHDRAAPDLSGYLPREPADPDRIADKAGRTGVLRAGLTCLDALAATFGADAELSTADVRTDVLPTALLDHDLLRQG